MSEMFKPVPWTIENLVAAVHLGSLRLPDIQRPFVWEKVKVQQLESVLHSQTVTATEKFQMSETEKELALSKGWGWVLGLE